MALEISAKRLFMGVQPAQVAVNAMNPNLRGGGVYVGVPSSP
jgi:hypothetical protein